jgi:hypothetical protein
LGEIQEESAALTLVKMETFEGGNHSSN